MTRIALVTTAIALALTGTQAAAQGGPRGDRPAFAEIDADGDSRVTAAELQAHRERMGDDRFAALDGDGDGAISREELRAAPGARAATRLMEHFDADGDGAITRDEIRATMAAQQAERHEARFDALDTDGDGAVSEEEFAELRAARGADLRERFGMRRDGFGRGGDGPRHGRLFGD